jgi:N-acetylglucosamine-6-sulfatase
VRRGPLTRRALLLLTVVIIATAVVAGSLRSTTHPRVSPGVVAAIPGHGLGSGLTSQLAGVGPHRPNIVFVLTDDLSNNLVKYMPHVRALQRAGMTFSNYTVDDSLCCPSRSSIFTGQFPHNTGVFSNNSPDGGFTLFHQRGEESHTFATALAAVGYRTAMMGKYLNGYLPYTKYMPDGTVAPKALNWLPLPTWVPPGWTTWDVPGSGYSEFRYVVNENHRLVWYGGKPSDYGVDVLSRLGQQFISTATRAQDPFLLEIATFAPHDPYTPAPRDANSFPGLRAPRGPAFNVLPRHAPPWLAHHPELNAVDIATIDHDFRLRVQAVQSVDRMIGDLEAQVRRSGQADNTVFVFSSDNGFHMGEYTFRPGKLTAFDTDINVPLVITGPGIPAHTVNPAVVQNIDLAPTFEAIAGVQPSTSVDGHSIVPLLTRSPGATWRSAALIEHHGLDFYANDPDFQTTNAGDPPTYQAIRTQRFTYVRYQDGEREYYNRKRDPLELDNIYRTLSARRIAQLDAEVRALAACHGSASCWQASQPRAQP